jgi:hypothetical protein
LTPLKRTIRGYADGEREEKRKRVGHAGS